MRAIIEYSQKHPIIVIIFILTGCVISILFLPRLWIDTSANSLMMAFDPDLDYYQETIKLFGSDAMMIVYVKDKNLFTSYKLSVLDKLVCKLSDERLVPGVLRIESLFSVNNLKGYAGKIDTTPLMDLPPETDVAAKAVLENALYNPILVGNLISEDGTTTVINLYLRPSLLDEKHSQAAAAKGIANVLKSKIDENDPNSKTFINEFDKVFEIGGAYERQILTSMIINDMRILLPLAFAVLMIMLIITIGSLSGAILPFLTSLISLIFTFGFMGACNLPLNILTFIIPILIIVIGSTEDVHILAEYMEGFYQKGTRILAIKFMARTIGTAVFLTALTTFLGFLSIALNRVTALIQFGLIAGFALFINPLVTFLLSPVYLTFFGTKPVRNKEKGVNFLTKLLLRIADTLIILIKRYKMLILIVFIGATIIIGLFSIRMKVDNESTSYFKKDSDIIQRMETMHNELSGIKTLFIRISRKEKDGKKKPDIIKDTKTKPQDEEVIVIDNDKDSGDQGHSADDDFINIDDTSESTVFNEEAETEKLFQNPKYMRLLDGIQRKFEKEYNFDKTISIANFIRIIHKEFNVGKPGDFDSTPDPDNPSSTFLIAQYVQLLHHDEISSYITTDWNEANIMVRHYITSSDKTTKVLRQLNSDLKNMLYECDPYLTFKVTGSTVLINKASDSIAISQVSSLGMLLLTILIIMSVLFTNIKAGLLSLIPNILPIVILFGIMGIFNIPLNIGTCMVAAIAIGISVDDTIHFMTRFNKEMREFQDRDRAIAAVIRAELRPILATSIALALTFIILSQSNILPIIYFGILTAVVMICALLADLLITPILLTSFQLINISDIASLKLANELKHSPIFKGMSMYQIKKFILMGKVGNKRTGEYVIKSGDEDQKMYILLSGKVEVQRKDRKTGKILFLTTFGTGDVFGEISLLRKAPRSADIVAEESITYLEIDWQGFRRIHKSSRWISLKLYLNLARILSLRLVQTTDLLEARELQ